MNTIITNLSFVGMPEVLEKAKKDLGYLPQKDIPMEIQQQLIDAYQGTTIAQETDIMHCPEKFFRWCIDQKLKG